MTNQFPDVTKMVLSPAGQALLHAYRDSSWVPDEEDNGRYYKWSHRAGIAAALRAAVDQVVPAPVPSDQRWNDVMAQRCVIRFELLAIAAELEGHQ